MTDQEPPNPPPRQGVEPDEAIARLKEALGEQDFNELAKMIAASGQEPYDYITRFYIAAKIKDAQDKQEAAKAAEAAEAARQAQAAADAAMLAAQAALEAAAKQGIKIYAKFPQPPDAYTAATLAAKIAAEQDETPELPNFAVDEDPKTTVKGQDFYAPKTTNIATSKAAQKIQEVDPNADSQRRYTVSNPHRHAIRTSVATWIPEDVKVNGKITVFDRAVEDAIGTLVDRGYKAFTIEDVFCILNGEPKGLRVHEKMAERIDQTIVKLARTWCNIDCTEQYNAVHREKQESVRISGNILLANRVKIERTNGRITIGWFVKELPKMYFYSKLVKQLYSVPYDIRKIEGLNATETTLAMKQYILTQMARIERKHGGSITLETMYNALDLTPNKVERNRLNKAVIKILEHFKATGFIANYTPEKRGRLLVGFEIIPNPKRRQLI
jgi:hypothetical protein